MKFNKFNKTKKIAYAGIVLTALSLTTVGFSTWVILGEVNTSQTGNVSVEVGNVEDQNFVIKLLGTRGVTDGQLKFDTVKNSSGPIQGSENLEDLSISISFSIDMATTTGFRGVSFVGISQNYNTISTMIGRDYIISPIKYLSSDAPSSHLPLIDSTWTDSASHYIQTDKNCNIIKVSGTNPGENTCYTKVDCTVQNTLRTYNVTFKYAWGSVFGGKNPSVADDSNPRGAAQYISALKLFVNNPDISFAIMLRHDPNKKITIAPMH